jgi:HTH-type transcriptional regulator, competence development regulator
MSDFGKTLKKLRKEREITQRDLALRVDVDFTYISKMENDKLQNSPSENTIRKIAKELGVDADELTLLAEKVPENIRKTIADDDLAVEFLRKVDHLSDDQRSKIKELIDKV